MRKISIYLLCLLIFKSGISQYSKIYFEEKDDYFTRNKFLSTSYVSYSGSEKEFDLKNGEKSFKYSVLRVPVQVDSFKKVYTYIDILIGATLKGNLFIVTDVNKNKEFLDDSIYVLNMDTLFEKRSNYIKAWPEILIDSFSYYFDGKILTSPLLLSMAIFPAPGFDYFKNSATVLNNKRQFLLHVFRNKYLSSSILLGNTAYELNIELFPFFYPGYKYLSEDSQLAFHQIAIYKKNNGKDSLIFRTSIKEVIDAIKSKAPIILDGYEIYFQNFSLLENYLEVSINKEKKITPLNNNAHPLMIKEISGFSLKDNKIITLKNGLKKYRVIFFTGSWCMPCHSAQKDFTKLFSKYKQKADFLTIACENSIIDAKKYYSTLNSKWDFFYESIKTKKESYLSNLFNITIFPSFYLIDSKGNTVYQGVSADSISEIDKILAE